MTDGVDASMDSVEEAPGDPVADHVGAEARGDELGRGHDAVLACRNRRDPPIHPTRRAFLGYMPRNVRVVGHAAKNRPKRVPALPADVPKRWRIRDGGPRHHAARGPPRAPAAPR